MFIILTVILITQASTCLILGSNINFITFMSIIDVMVIIAMSADKIIKTIKEKE